jgi:hypothetical protein
MWIRGDLKMRAKDALRKNGYWPAFGVSFILALVAGGPGAGGGNSSFTYEGDMAQSPLPLSPLAPLLVSFIVAFVVATLIYVLFFANPLTVGSSRFYLEHRNSRVGVGRIFWPFRPGYLNVVKSLVMQGVMILLWSLLFIIPGIIKSYQYCMVPYILAENPRIRWSRALELSRRMTQGSKFGIFVLQLSFIGWFLLGSFAMGIGILFVFPYYEATFAELYAHLRAQAIENGITSHEELPEAGN